MKISSKHLHAQTVSARELNLLEVSPPPTYHVSCVMCRMSHVTCHMSHVTCHIWCVTCKKKIYVEARIWRDCYQWGLSRLDSMLFSTSNESLNVLETSMLTSAQKGDLYSYKLLCLSSYPAFCRFQLHMLTTKTRMLLQICPDCQEGCPPPIQGLLSTYLWWEECLVALCGPGKGEGTPLGNQGKFGATF